MKVNLKKSLVISALLGVLVPLGVKAATQSQSTTITANIASVISLTTLGNVAINVTPIGTGSGSQSSNFDTVQVSTNHSGGYTLTLANADATTTLVKGSDTIAAHAGTQTTPTALAANTWGYAVASVGGFDSSYSAITNDPGSTSKWAGVPQNSSPNTLKTTATTASADPTTVWYSVKATTAKPNGAYSDIVSYTATTN